jgi:polar amino acid transport system substrate-binding protein
MKKVIISAAALLMAVGLILSGCGSSDGESWSKIEGKGQFVMGLDENFPPMGFRDEKGEITGFDVDVAKEVCSRLGIELKVQPINWDAKEQELNTGNIDAIWNGFTITKERQAQVLFSEPYMKNRQVLVVMENSGFNSQEDLKDKKLGIQAASSAADALNSEEDFKSSLAEVVEFDDNMMALMDLEKGGVDTVLMDEIVARYYIQMKDKGYKVLDKELASEEYGIGFRKGDKQLQQKFGETLTAMAKDGKLAEISIKWFGEDISTIAK